MKRLVLILVVLLFVALIACSGNKNLTGDSNGNSLCCQECLYAANRDPSGYDISIKPCSEYELSSSCAAYFRDTSVLVMDCLEVDRDNI